MANPGFKIDVKSGPGITQSCVISTDRPLNFGRHRSNDCVLSNDPGISRQHFQIYYEAATCWIKDLNSRNGTYLNDHLVISSEIKNRDEIRVGSTRLIFALSDHSTPVETPTLADLGNQPLEPKTNLGIQNGDTTTIVMPRKLLAGKFSKREMLNEQLIDSFSRLPGRTILACNLERNKLIIEEGLEFEQVDKSRALLVSPSK
ncbi:MAG: FHA domain-containing protein, partial [Planctomycetota bacterium]